jgi:hypothetical protein
MGASLAASRDPWSRLLRALPAALAEEGDVLEAPTPPASARAALGPR